MYEVACYLQASRTERRVGSVPFPPCNPCVCATPRACSPEASRKVVAYVGGIDLTCGRYDTSAHHLFKTLSMTHEDDFYNACFPNAVLAKGGAVLAGFLHLKPCCGRLRRITLLLHACLLYSLGL